MLLACRSPWCVLLQPRALLGVLAGQLGCLATAGGRAWRASVWVGKSRWLAFWGPCRPIAGPSHGRAPRRHSSPPAFSFGGVVVSSPFWFVGMVSRWPIARSCLSKCEHLLHHIFAIVFRRCAHLRRVAASACVASGVECVAACLSCWGRRKLQAASCKLDAQISSKLPPLLQQGHPTWVLVTTTATIMLWWTHGAARQRQPLWSWGDFRRTACARVISYRIRGGVRVVLVLQR